jgi:hypothetical protein
MVASTTIWALEASLPCTMTVAPFEANGFAVALPVLDVEP